jgi:predicted Zn-dependent protease with MMP-like domain
VPQRNGIGLKSKAASIIRHFNIIGRSTPPCDFDRAAVGFSRDQLKTSGMYNGSVERERFEQVVNEVLESLPDPFRSRLSNLAIIVEDSPPLEPHRGGLLLGLFSGVPMTLKSVFSADPPNHIFLYQKNIEAVCSSEAQIRRQIRDTLLHEIGHYFGLNEEELRNV